MRLVAALTLVFLAGCSSVNERWASATFEGISYLNLYGSMTTTVAAEGFDVSVADAQSARLDSEWTYGTSQRMVRGPSRRRVHGMIESAGPDIWTVRIRVEEEIIRKAGMLATEVRDSKDWESFEDNYDDAEYLMAKLSALLEAYRTRGAAP